MNQDAWANIVLVLVFILVGGVFAGSELALVSLRESQLSRLESNGGRGARVAAVAGDTKAVVVTAVCGAGGRGPRALASAMVLDSLISSLPRSGRDGPVLCTRRRPSAHDTQPATACTPCEVATTG